MFYTWSNTNWFHRSTKGARYTRSVTKRSDQEKKNTKGVSTKCMGCPNVHPKFALFTNVLLHIEEAHCTLRRAKPKLQKITSVHSYCWHFGRGRGCRQRMRIERSEHVGNVHWANTMFALSQNQRYKSSKNFHLNCLQSRQQDGTFDCDIWFRLLFEPPCDSLWTARCWLFPDLKATASKSERLLRITTGREYAARYALGWSLTTCLGSA